MKQVKNNFLLGHPIIAQLLSMVPKEIFNQVVEQENADRYFVTHKKDKTRYEVLTDFECSHSQDIKRDQVISLKYREKGVSRTVKGRLVFYIDPESGEELDFITNLPKYSFS